MVLQVQLLENSDKSGQASGIKKEKDDEQREITLGFFPDFRILPQN